MGIAPPCHSRNEKTTDTWITPKWLIERLGAFDLDPCAAIKQPWPCASQSFTEVDNGLLQQWRGMVWCNPPYGQQTALWLGRMALHGNGIALVFARTETRMFFQHVWPVASGILFLKGRLTFCCEDGIPSKPGHNSGGPSVLVSYGPSAFDRLRSVSDLGKFVALRSEP